MNCIWEHLSRQGEVQKKVNGTTHTSLLYNNSHYAEKKQEINIEKTILMLPMQRLQQQLSHID
ncbi:MAG: hypothetical protein CM15mV11_2750 [Caudoviricetes sp.]|nr:MAG: hypothetical protein CM15mV11_2750 [Caudoviricetes sp.]